MAELSLSASASSASTREQPVVISFGGRPIQARQSDTVASALFRAGVRTFSRSFKYHRPRGLLCAAGKCPNCLMTVDGVPNVRVCTMPVHDGMQVRGQNAFPSVENDWLSVAQWFGFLMPVGFYYKTFTHPRVWGAVQPIIRRVAGLGAVPAEGLFGPDAHDSYEHVYLHAQTAVVGGGPAGLQAAVEAAGGGDSVVLIDDQPELGGHLRYAARPYNGADPGDEARRLATRLAELPNVRVLQRATCFGLYEGSLLGIVQRGSGTESVPRPHSAAPLERLIHLRAGRVVVATGAYEVPLLFKNNDLPGVMLSSAAQRLANSHGIKPGDLAVIVTRRPDGGPVEEDLRAAGVRIAAMVSPDVVVAAEGRGHVTGLRTTQELIPCDLVVVDGVRLPDAGLIAQAGGRLEWSDARGVFAPTHLPPNVVAVGEAAGGAAAASQSSVPAAALTGGPMLHDSSFVCLCEDVTAKDLRRAIDEGFDHIETLKRYTTVTMGPCQGKMCHLASIGVCARHTGRSIGGTGMTTARPPAPPVSLGALAGARHHPVKRTPMHAKHDALGCVWMDMGEWKRPLYYPHGGGTSGAALPLGSGSPLSEGQLEAGVPPSRVGKGARGLGPAAVVNGAAPPPDAKRASAEAEYRAVRERVGVIDLSTLGKLDVKGADAARLLDKVYTNRLSDLRPGRARYSVICDDAGIMLDDGTVSRLAGDHFFVTTTTGNLEFVQQWLEWWAAGTGWCVHVTNVTSGLAAVNVAGPQARSLLRKLTDCDLSTRAFPFMACRQADVAGVPCLMLRIGFVGEMGWEIHFPADYGEYLWDALLEAGAEFGVRPFGVEAQRVLRLDKGHVIVGVDTDAMSTPLHADMAWVAKLDKEDFIGKAALLRLQSGGMHERLVGFVMDGTAVPDDGAAIVRDGRPFGRVTSSRFSPAAGRTVGMAFVLAQSAADGSDVLVRVNGGLARATFAPVPFYDPDGRRLRG
jgi:sarcosine oxidase subunit alpha